MSDAPSKSSEFVKPLSNLQKPGKIEIKAGPAFSSEGQKPSSVLSVDFMLSATRRIELALAGVPAEMLTHVSSKFTFADPNVRGLIWVGLTGAAANIISGARSKK